jgi:hypothetical protein
VPDNLVSPISRRTFYNFKNYDFIKVYGFAYSKERLDLARNILESQTLFKLNKAILSIKNTIINIYSYANNNFNYTLKTSSNARMKVIETIKRTKNILGLSKSCKLFHISRSTFFNWKNAKVCSDSIFNKCFKRHPHQLSKKEVSKIRFILNNPMTKLWPIISS